MSTSFATYVFGFLYFLFGLTFSLSRSGPHNDKRTGSRMNPFAQPNTIIPNHILKKVIKMYD